MHISVKICTRQMLASHLQISRLSYQNLSGACMYMLLPNSLTTDVATLKREVKDDHEDNLDEDHDGVVVLSMQDES